MGVVFDVLVLVVRLVPPSGHARFVQETVSDVLTSIAVSGYAMDSNYRKRDQAKPEELD